MWTYNALLLFVCLVLAIHSEGVGSECQPTDFLVIQQKCKEQNGALLAAERDHRDKEVCKSLYELWECVAREVPACFHNITHVYKKYLHSPHTCRISAEQLQILQDLVRGSSATHQNSSEHSSSSTVIPTAESTSLSSVITTVEEEGSGDEGADEGEGGEGWDNATTTSSSVISYNVSSGPDGGGSGEGHHKHTGNDASSQSSHCWMTKMAATWLVTWLLTSSFPHS